MPDFHNAMAGGQVTERLPATLPTPGDVLEVLVRNSRRVPQLEELDMGDVVVYTRQVVGIHNLTSLKYVRPRAHTHVLETAVFPKPLAGYSSNYPAD